MITPPRKSVLLWPPSNADLSEIARQLHFYGFEVEMVQDAPSFLHRLAEQRLQAAVYDGAHASLLPAAQKGRLRELARDIPTLCVAARGDLHARMEATRLGCQAYLLLPLDIGGLLDSLDRLTLPRQIETGQVTIVDDSPSSAALHAAHLQQAGYLTSVLTEPLRLLDHLQASPPELILMAMSLPGASGEELARVIRQQDALLSIPIVFLSAETDAPGQGVAMATGGDEYLQKPIRAEQLVAVVSSRIAHYRALRGVMTRDSLTGLLNHAHFKERLRVEIARSQRSGRPATLALLDIDHLKTVNDGWGHLSGDRVIRNLARLLKQRLRVTDVIGRYGGEEFAVALPDTPLAEGVRVIEAMRASFTQLSHGLGEQDWRCTLSAGLARCPPHSDADALIHAADEALCTAKRAGRNRIAVAEAAVE